jgi:hypothetical protein
MGLLERCLHAEPQSACDLAHISIFNLIVINSCGGVFANIREHVPGAGGIAAVFEAGGLMIRGSKNLGGGPPGEKSLNISGGAQRLRLRLYDSFADGIANQSRSVMDIQFVHHI